MSVNRDRRKHPVSKAGLVGNTTIAIARITREFDRCNGCEAAGAA